MVKVIKDLKKEDFRNIFLNLAVPFLQAGEPADVMKDKLLDDLSVSIWDRWELKDFKDGSLKSMMSKIEEMHKGLEVKDIIRGNTPIYFSAIMDHEFKAAEKKKTLEASLRSLTESESDQYVDITITVVKKDDPEQKILSGVPPVRVFF